MCVRRGEDACVPVCLVCEERTVGLSYLTQQVKVQNISA